MTDDCTFVHVSRFELRIPNSIQRMTKIKIRVITRIDLLKFLLYLYFCINKTYSSFVTNSFLNSGPNARGQLHSINDINTMSLILLLELFIHSRLKHIAFLYMMT